MTSKTPVSLSLSKMLSLKMQLEPNGWKINLKYFSVNLVAPGVLYSCLFDLNLDGLFLQSQL